MKIKSPFDEPREVPALGHRTIAPGEVVDVPDDQLPSFLEGGWHPADAATKTAGGRLYAKGIITVLAGVDAARLARLRGDQADEHQGDDDTNDGEG